MSLAAGMLPPDSELGRQCPGSETPQVAAVVNWIGITDVVDLLEGANEWDYAVAWLGSQPDRKQIAARVSPVNFVTTNLPPILTIQGDADPVVPYDHAVQLHERLDSIGVINQLYTVPKGKHGGFGEEEGLKIFDVIFQFLADNLAG